MKNTHRFLIVGAAVALIASASQAKAGTGPCCDDGIAASPKVRAVLDERCKSNCAVPAQLTVTTITPQAQIAASPKVQQMRNERATVAVVGVAAETASYSPTGADGIAASPKVRAMLNERAPATQIAPLK
jgi:hypothetical protein